MKRQTAFLFFAILAVVGGGAIVFLAAQNYFLDRNKSILEDEISQTAKNSLATTKKFANDVKNLNTDIATLSELLDSANAGLATTTAQLAETTRRLADTAAQSADFQAQYNVAKNTVSDLQGQVGTLKKLTETDPELLKKYSKVYFLNENYTSKSLAEIDPEYTYNPDENYQFYSETYPFLKSMLATAKADGIDLKIISAYRSFGEQSSLKASYKMTYGAGANKFSADQGYSEHQLGTAVDFTTADVGASFDGFEKTPAYQWLNDNAYVYGFILSYPADNTYYQYEPWHWRFVGRQLAQYLHNQGKHFYDLDQRTIDQYLISFFD